MDDLERGPAEGRESGGRGSFPRSHVVYAQAPRRELFDDDLVELPLLGGGEELLFLEDVLHNLVFELGLAAEDILGCS